MPHNESETKSSRLFQKIGPGLVTACVVIGPGSILTSSKVGAVEGYSKIWVVVLAVFFMLTYITLGMRLGAVSGTSNGDLIRRHMSRWYAILIGFCVFYIAAAYQFGNNLGAHSALSAYSDFKYWPLVLNGISLAFLFGFKNLYKLLERVMTFFVALMLVAFTMNLIFARPDPVEMAAGLNPLGGGSTIGIPLLGLIGTTFVINAAFYQSYLVRFKGWTVADLKNGMVDARVSAAIMAVITIMIMSTAAAVLQGRELSSVADVANQLEPLFGEKGRVIFCIGLFAAAFSSFIINSMTGGFILADALNLGSTPQDRWPRYLTAAVLLIGMGVGMYVIETGAKPVSAIVAAQATTVIAAPLIAFALLWLTNLESVMGERRNGIWMNLAAGSGLVVLIAMSIYTAVEKVWPAISGSGV
jgi:NRAMP (natural resistance-associated macrophage protein)-like metal ion transporter